jgi:hypothetical protein
MLSVKVKNPVAVRVSYGIYQEPQSKGSRPKQGVWLSYEGPSHHNVRGFGDTPKQG